MVLPEAAPEGLESALRDIASRLTAIERRLEEVSSGGQGSRQGSTAAFTSGAQGSSAAFAPSAGVDLSAVSPLIAMAGDVIDEQAAKLGNVEERVQAALSLLERVSRPETLRTLTAAVELLEQVPNTVAILGDSLEEALGAASSHGQPLDEWLSGLMDTGKRGLTLLASREFRALLDSPMLDARMLDTLGNLSRAIVETTRNGVEPAGVFGALQAMGKTPVRKAVGFALGVAARLGATLEDTHSLAALPAARGGGQRL